MSRLARSMTLVGAALAVTCCGAIDDLGPGWADGPPLCPIDQGPCAQPGDETLTSTDGGADPPRPDGGVEEVDCAGYSRRRLQRP